MYTTELGLYQRRKDVEEVIGMELCRMSQNLSDQYIFQQEEISEEVEETSDYYEASTDNIVKVTKKVTTYKGERLNTQKEFLSKKKSEIFKTVY